ncbi:MAG: Flp pilus assembly protein CpaB [Pseudomonadota bacterium]
MNVRQLAIIGAALIIAAGAFFWMRSQNANNAAQVAPVVAAPKAEMALAKVLVARREMNIGDRVLADSVGWAYWPLSGVSAAFITQQNAPKAVEDYENAVVRLPLVIGEPITTSKVVRANAPVSAMVALVTPGMRATAVSITAEAGVAGFILPDNRVDVILTRAITAQSNGQNFTRTVSSTIFENVRVLAIDQNMATTKDQRSITGTTATLELSVGDAEKLRTADSLGDISLALRGYSDATGTTVSRTDALALLQPVLPNGAVVKGQGGPNGAPGGPNDAAKTVKIYRGGQ